MLTTLVTRKTASTLPLLALDEAEFARWTRSQSKAVKRWLKSNDFEPKGNRVLLVPGPEGPRLALLGKADHGLWTWASAARRLPQGRYRLEAELEEPEATDAAIGWALAAYRYDRYKTSTKKDARELLWPARADRAEVARVVTTIGMVRDLINAPAEDLGPSEMLRATKEVAQRYGAKVVAVRGKKLADGFPAIHAVGRGSARAPLLIDLTHGDPKAPRVSLVGKGVCFDSGGLDLKTSAGMLRMKKDMGGAAHVLGLAQLIMDRELPVRLRMLIPAVENLPGPNAFRPSDVLTTRKGTTVEVSNTDAEGRLVLADALFEADSDEPDLLVDVATLTGSARLAVGPEIQPFFTRNKAIADDLGRAARRARDPVWRMPLHLGYRRHLDSHVADLKNAASTHLGGSITAALFLREFVSDKSPWLHMDIMGWNDHVRPGRPYGGEATGLRALWELLKDRYEDR